MGLGWAALVVEAPSSLGSAGLGSCSSFWPRIHSRPSALCIGDPPSWMGSALAQGCPAPPCTPQPCPPRVCTDWLRLLCPPPMARQPRPALGAPLQLWRSLAPTALLPPTCSLCLGRPTPGPPPPAADGPLERPVRWCPLLPSSPALQCQQDKVRPSLSSSLWPRPLLPPSFAGTACSPRWRLCHTRAVLGPSGWPAS